jgi:hypothetical protein
VLLAALPSPVDGYVETTFESAGNNYTGAIMRNEGSDPRRELVGEMTPEGWIQLIEIWYVTTGYNPAYYHIVEKTATDYVSGTPGPMKMRVEAIGNFARLYLNDVLTLRGYLSYNLAGTRARTGGWRNTTFSIYRFEMGTFAVGAWLPHSTPTGTTATVSGLIQGAQYDYRVAAVVGTQTDWSATKSHVAGLGVPTITTVTPSTAATGTLVSVTGTNFGTDLTTVTFDNGTEIPVQSKTFTTLDFTVPTHANGATALRVRTANGDSAPSTFTFTGGSGMVTSDNFNRSNVSPLDAPWTNRGSGLLAISGNQVVIPNVNDDSLYQHSVHSDLHGYIQADVRQDSGYLGMSVQINSPFRSDISMVIYPDGTVHLERQPGGAQLATAWSGYVAGSTVLARIEWDINPGVTADYRVYIDGTLRLNAVGVTSAVGTAGTYGVGVGGYRMSGVTTIDNFEMGTLPTTAPALYSDNFNQANGARAGWTTPDGSPFAVVSNTYAATVAGTSCASVYNTPVGSDDMWAEATLVGPLDANFAATLLVRMATTGLTGLGIHLSNGYSGAGLVVWAIRFNAGSETSLSGLFNIENPTVAGHVFAVSVTGANPSVVNIFIDGVSVFGTTSNDTLIDTGQYAGFRTYEASAGASRWDNFRTGSGAYPGLVAPKTGTAAVTYSSTVAATGVKPASGVTLPDTFDRASLGAEYITNSVLTDWEIVSSTLRAKTIYEGDWLLWAQPIGADVEVSGSFDVAGSIDQGASLLIARSSAAVGNQSGVAVQLLGGQWGGTASGHLTLRLMTITATSESPIGSDYDLGTPSIPFTTKTITLRCVGDKISVLYDGAVVIGPVTNTTYQTNTYAGTRLYDGAAAGQHRLREFNAQPYTPPSSGITFRQAKAAPTQGFNVYVSEYAGVDTASPVRIAHSSATGSSTVAAAPATGALTVGDLVYAFMCHQGGTQTLTEDIADGFSLACENEAGDNNNAGGAQYKVATATTSLVPNWTTANGQNWLAERIVFKKAPAAISYVDFTTAPNGAHADFTHIQDGNVIVYNGQYRVHNGTTPGTDVVDWYWAYEAYEIPDTDVSQIVECELLLPTTGSGVRLYWHAAANLTSSNHSFEISGNGAWNIQYESGLATVSPNSGNMGVLTAGVVNIKVTAPTSGTVTVVVNGTTLVNNATIGPARTGLYSGLFGGEDVRIRKFGFPNGLT